MIVYLVPLTDTRKEIEDRKPGALTEPFNKDEIKLVLFCTRHIVHTNPSFPFVSDIKIEKSRNSMACDVTTQVHRLPPETTIASAATAVIF